MTWPLTTNRNTTFCTATNAQKHSTTPSSLAQHQYSHGKLKDKCKCREDFLFKSMLQYHCLSHHKLATHCCVYPDCGKKFKNKGDLTWHLGIMHQCPIFKFNLAVNLLYFPSNWVNLLGIFTSCRKLRAFKRNPCFWNRYLMPWRWII